MKPDIYIVAPVPERVSLDLQKDLPGQLFTFEQQQQLFILLPDIRVVSITPAFAILVSPLVGPLTENGAKQLDTLKEQGVIDLYRVVNR